MSITAYPLSWPTGWRRTEPSARTSGRFGKQSESAHRAPLSIGDGIHRVQQQLWRMAGDATNVVVSSNLALRQDGAPRARQEEPGDTGVAVYWTDREGHAHCMAVDRYRRVADNLAAIAATLDAMASIERHGGAEVLTRAFSGFAALPPPQQSAPWYEVLQCAAAADEATVRAQYRRLRSEQHPDRGGSQVAFLAVCEAWEAYLATKAPRAA